MSLERDLKKRADNKCELCSNDEHLEIYTLAPHKDLNLKKSFNP